MSFLLRIAEASSIQVPSGYDEEFVCRVEEDLECSICHQPLKEPVLTRCGHRFCKECIEEHFRRQKSSKTCITCPEDRQKLDTDKDVFPDKATERKILSLIIRCPNHQCTPLGYILAEYTPSGCKWTGELREKETHLERCQWKLIPCTNEKCQVQVRKISLDHHLRKICQWRIMKCVHCNGSYPKCEMKNHVEKCPKRQLPCPNKCGQSIPREGIYNHTQTICPLEIINCPYQYLGCERKILRREVDHHLENDIKSHLDFACAKLKDTAKELGATKRLVDTRMFIWKIGNFDQVLKQATNEQKEELESDPFYSTTTESYGYKLQVSVYPNGIDQNSHLSVFIAVKRGDYDAMLLWPLKKKVTFTLIDQQEDPNQRENVIMQFITGNFPEDFKRPLQEESTGIGFPEFVSHEKLNSRRYIVDDTLFLQVEVGPPSS